jgi:hypothetical protein
MLTNVAAVLARHSATPADVIKRTAMLADMGEWAEMNQGGIREGGWQLAHRVLSQRRRKG